MWQCALTQAWPAAAMQGTEMADLTALRETSSAEENCIQFAFIWKHWLNVSNLCPVAAVVLSQI